MGALASRAVVQAGVATKVFRDEISECKASNTIRVVYSAPFMPPLLGLGVHLMILVYKHAAPLALRGSGRNLG